MKLSCTARDFRFVACLVCLLALLFVRKASGSSTLIPVTSPVDVVYDAPRDILYISSGTNVLRYQLGSSSFLSPYGLSGSLMGMDISPDGNTLLVAADSGVTSNVWLHVVNLTNGQSRKAQFPAAFMERGTFAVAFGYDGAALVTSRFAGSGYVPLRRYDPVTDTFTIITNSVRQDTMVSSSADRRSIALAQSNDSGGPFNRYDVTSRTITRSGSTGWSVYECGTSRDGSIYAVPTYYNTFIYDGNFNRITNIGVYAGQQPIGAAFHPNSDAVFFPIAGTNVVRAYDTTTWGILGDYSVTNNFTTPGNHAFNNGRIRLSPDGQTVFVTVSTGVRYFQHGLSLPLKRELIISGNPGQYGAPTPAYGIYWMNDGSSQSISAPGYFLTNGVPYICAGWTGTGSVPASGASGSTATFTISENSTLTWNWVPFSAKGTLVSDGANYLKLTWPGVSGVLYDVFYSATVTGPFSAIATDLPPNPPQNSYQVPAGPDTAGFYKIRIK